MLCLRLIKSPKSICWELRKTKDHVALFHSTRIPRRVVVQICSKRVKGRYFNENTEPKKNEDYELN